MQNFTKDTGKKILEVVKENFPNGIRDDFIDINKVRKIYSTIYPEENISQDFITDIIHENGIEDGGRFYFISDNNLENIRRFFDELLKSNPLAYYTKIFEKHSDFFSDIHIFSPDVLKKILQTAVKNHFYFSEFCSAEKTNQLDFEVRKIFMDSENSLSLDDLQKNLPYVPQEKILEVLSDEKNYLPTNTGKYFLSDKIQLEFDLDEINDAKKKISFHIEKDGYALPENYSLVSNFQLNPELSEKYLRNVIYKKFFSNDFIKSGRKFFKKGEIIKKEHSMGAVELIKNFIADKNEVDVKEFLALDKNVIRRPHVIIDATLEKMVRVDKNFFVKDELINFDVDGTDAALELFVQGKIISLRSVTSFTGFPAVEGYSWNLFLLESFLRKYSKKYSYDAPVSNNSNAGAIFPKSMKLLNYFDVQVAAIIQENIPLDISEVEKFLISQGYRMRCSRKTTEQIISGVQEILNRRRF